MTTLDELTRRLMEAANNPPKITPLRFRGGRVTRQTMMSRQRAIEQAKVRLGEDARKALGG